MKLRIAARVELTLILAAAYFAGSGILPTRISIGHLVLYLSALLLAQSLLRDLWLLYAKRHSQPATRIEARCMCAESTVGMTGIIAGLLLAGFGFAGLLTISASSWAMAVFLVLLLGFLLRDYIIELAPLRLRRDEDHINIVVAWKPAKR